MLEINETPVRTSRNFNINNIKIEDIKISSKVREFNNINISEVPSKIELSENTDNSVLTYGISEDFTKQVIENANFRKKIIIDSKTNKQLKFEFNFDEKNLELIDDFQIIANENTKATIIIKYSIEKDLEAYHNGIIKVHAKNGANINVIVVNLLNLKSNNFISIENTLDSNSKVIYTIVDFGGKNSITNYYSNLVGESSDNSLNSIYLGKENQLFDLNYIGELRGEKSNIDIEVQGALKDVSKKHFKGTIDFKKGCKKARGNENENCMLLSDTAKSLALPMLLCSEEDVEGAHSTSAGKIGEKELFYIMSRGFELKEAMKLLVRAKFNKILENIKDDELKQEILDEIDRRLD